MQINRQPDMVADSEKESKNEQLFEKGQTGFINIDDGLNVSRDTFRPFCISGENIHKNGGGNGDKSIRSRPGANDIGSGLGSICEV